MWITYGSVSVVFLLVFSTNFTFGERRMVQNLSFKGTVLAFPKIDTTSYFGPTLISIKFTIQD